MLSPQFGGKITAQDTEHYSKSKHWRDGKFQNLEETTLSISFWDLPEIICKQLSNRTERQPSSPIPISAIDQSSFQDQDQAQLIWYGHSTVLMRMNATTILIDPMFGPDASPIGPIRTKRYSKDTLSIIDTLPAIDVVLLSHDHYDHLDYESMQRLKGKVGHYFVALGVKRHLVKWGIDPQLVREFDWWESSVLNSIDITFTPSRHFSGRGLTDRAKSLWGGWTFRTDQENIWFSGDGGYGEHFREIGERLGPFDLGFIECGQYNEKWHQIHMYPEESVQAGVDGRAAVIVPVHWGAFTLAPHTWTDPIERFTAEARAKQVRHLAPAPGQQFLASATADFDTWWEAYV
jgi:L-ascorbate metabolism protein UlaG (beta-lactamase superfamily)